MVSCGFHHWLSLPRFNCRLERLASRPLPGHNYYLQRYEWLCFGNQVMKLTIDYWAALESFDVMHYPNYHDSCKDWNFLINTAYNTWLKKFTDKNIILVSFILLDPQWLVIGDCNKGADKSFMNVNTNYRS